MGNLSLYGLSTLQALNKVFLQASDDKNIFGKVKKPDRGVY